jgi:hypothetical protein
VLLLFRAAVCRGRQVGVRSVRTLRLKDACSVCTTTDSHGEARCEHHSCWRRRGPDGVRRVWQRRRSWIPHSGARAGAHGCRVCDAAPRGRGHGSHVQGGRAIRLTPGFACGRARASVALRVLRRSASKKITPSKAMYYVHPNTPSCELQYQARPPAADWFMRMAAGGCETTAALHMPVRAQNRLSPAPRPFWQPDAHKHTHKRRSARTHTGANTGASLRAPPAPPYVRARRRAAAANAFSALSLVTW